MSGEGSNVLLTPATVAGFKNRCEHGVKGSRNNVVLFYKYGTPGVKQLYSTPFKCSVAFFSP